MIYIVEDDAAIRELEQYALQSSGYEVQSFETSEPFWQAMRTAEPELVILDVMLPGEDGFSILKKLRNTPALRRLPIIMVTAKSSELDTVRGLDCGADDYITKPFGIMEFLSRVRAALRRSAPEEKQNVYAFHEILLDNARHSVTVNGTHIDLTYKEYSLLRLLLENTNLVVTRETILQVVWGTDISVESRTVDMHIRTLRKKLGDAGRYICTVRKSATSWPTVRRARKNETAEHGRKNQLPAVFHGLRRSGLHRRALSLRLSQSVPGTGVDLAGASGRSGFRRIRTAFLSGSALRVRQRRPAHYPDRSRWQCGVRIRH